MVKRITVAAALGIASLSLAPPIGAHTGRARAGRPVSRVCGAGFRIKAKTAITARSRTHDRRLRLGEAYILLKTTPRTRNTTSGVYEFCWVLDLDRLGRRLTTVLQTTESDKNGSVLEQGSNPLTGARSVGGTNPRPDAARFTMRLDWLTYRGQVKEGTARLSAHV